MLKILPHGEAVTQVERAQIKKKRVSFPSPKATTVFYKPQMTSALIH